MTIRIKNMVCPRCIMAVKQLLTELNMAFRHVELGEATLEHPPSQDQMTTLAARLQSLGFELLDEPHKKLIDQIKTLLITEVQKEQMPEHFSLSKFIGKAMLKDYSLLSRLFSETEGITLEQYLILQKIEKVKELLAYGQQTLSEISWKMGYSSVAHLSAQFKKVTGFTPSQFRQLDSAKRHSLDAVHNKM